MVLKGPRKRHEWTLIKRVSNSKNLDKYMFRIDETFKFDPDFIMQNSWDASYKGARNAGLRGTILMCYFHALYNIKKLWKHKLSSEEWNELHSHMQFIGLKEPFAAIAWLLVICITCTGLVKHIPNILQIFLQNVNEEEKQDVLLCPRLAWKGNN